MFQINKSRSVSRKSHFVLVLQFKDRILCSITTWYTNSFQWKDLKTSLRLIFFFFRSKLAHDVSSSDGVSVSQNSSSNPTTRWVRDTLKCELGKKEVWTPDVGLLSESRVYTLMRGVYTNKMWILGNRELRMSRQFWRSVSQRRLQRETEKYEQKIFHPKQCWFLIQRQQWIRNGRRSYSGIQNNKKESPLCCIDGHPLIQKYMYTPWLDEICT